MSHCTANPSTGGLPGRMSYLRQLEAEAIFILREVVAQFENPCMFYSIGKDSTVMLHLARKAFAPGPVPFPLLHVDTTWEFREMAQFRDQLRDRLGLKILVHVNQDGVQAGINPFEHGSRYTDIMKTEALKQALQKYGFDACFGGGRRDEEKSRAKERIFSFRDAQQRWDPKNQRPELWSIYNGRINPGENIRVFPISNWTELDVWHYILMEQIDIVPLYFAQTRPVVEYQGALICVDDERILPHLTAAQRSGIQPRQVRFRTLGCYPLTGAMPSRADTLPGIVAEMQSSTSSERQNRLIDHDQAGSMEKKKREGYF